MFVQPLVNHLARHYTLALRGLPPELLALVERLDGEELGGGGAVTVERSQEPIVLLEAEPPGEGIRKIYPDTNTAQWPLRLEQRQLSICWNVFNITDYGCGLLLDKREHGC